MAPRTKPGTLSIASEPGKPLQLIEHSPQAEFDPGVIGDEMMTDDLALIETLNQIGAGDDGAKVMVYAVGPSGKDEYMYQCSPAEFATGGLDEIRTRYGGGEYRIRIYGQGRGIITHRRITIRDAKVPDAGQQAAQAVGNIGEMANIMRQGFEALGALIVKQSQTAPPFDPNAQRMAMLHEMQIMRDLFTPQEPRGGGMAETLGLVRELAALQRDMAPPATDGNGNVDPFGVLLKALDIFGKPLADAYNKQGSVPSVARNPAPAIAPPVTTTLPVPASGGMVYTPPENDVNFFAKQIAAAMIGRAVANESPADTALQILDQAPQEMVDMLNEPDWFDRLCALDPNATAHRSWFESVRTEVIAGLTAEQNPVT